MASVTPASNATLNADDVQRILINPLRQASSYLRLGMQEFISNGSVVKIPSLTSLGTATFIAPGTAIAEATVTTSEVELLPSDVWATKRLIRVSNESMAQAVFGVENAFGNALVTELQRVVDQKLWAGAGSAGEPLGLTGFTNNIAYSTAVGTVDANDLYSMIEVAQENYLNEDALHWALSPTQFRRIRVLEDTSGRNFLQPSGSAGAPATILGVPYSVTTFIADTALYLFDKSQIAVGIDNTASVFITPHRFADTGETAIIATFRADTAPMNAAVVAATGVTA